MPNTRKKVIKTVYKDEDSELETGDFSDSGSEAHFSDQSDSDEEVDQDLSSDEDFEQKKKSKKSSKPTSNKSRFSKNFLNKLNKQKLLQEEENEDIEAAPVFSVKDLTEEDKLLPSILNLSESDSSEDESPRYKPSLKTHIETVAKSDNFNSDNENEIEHEYKDVWSANRNDNSEDIAKKAFMELEQHKLKIEQTKASIERYSNSKGAEESDVNNLLAMGEEMILEPQDKKKVSKVGRSQNESDSEMEDWEEVKESKTIPSQGLQLIVDFPDAACRKKKTVDVEMMMRRKINRVKKEYQVYMHKVHVLCWLGHGNYVSQVLNDQEVMAAALSFVPAKECYPGERVDLKYVEQISTWFKDKLSLKQDKNENKYRPKAPPLKEILLNQIKKRVVTSKKYMVFIFVSMLRALGLQSRVMFNFVALPIKPPSSELCSLSTKVKTDKASSSKSKKSLDKQNDNIKKTSEKVDSSKRKKIKQVDGNFDDTDSGEEMWEQITQLDGNDDVLISKPVKCLRPRKNEKKTNLNENKETEEDVSPPKRSRKSPSNRNGRISTSDQLNVENENLSSQTKTRNMSVKREAVSEVSEMNQKGISPQKKTRKNQNQKQDNKNTAHLTEVITKSESSSGPGGSITKIKRNKEDGLDVNINHNNEQSKQSNRGNTKRNITPKDKTKDKGSGSSTKKDKGDDENVSSIFFEKKQLIASDNKDNPCRSRSRSHNPRSSQNSEQTDNNVTNSKTRNKSVPKTSKSKYFNNDEIQGDQKLQNKRKYLKTEEKSDDALRVSHRDLRKSKSKPKNDVTDDLVDIVKKRVREAKAQSLRNRQITDLESDSDQLPEESHSRRSGSSADFMPSKVSRKAGVSRRIDRRVVSTDDEASVNKTDVWCEVFVEELEQWIAVEVVKAKVHSTKDIYGGASHPMCYVVGWDNNNYLKDVTRRYVPHWNTVTRKQRAEAVWWETALRPWRGPKTPKDREEDEQLDKMQLEAPLPKSITEYKNHPLYALTRHLLKFEAIYPADARVLGFVRGEPVYARECVHTCRSRDTWLKEAKVVRPKQQPYKIVKARPKWDKLSNKLITDKPLEVFGPWQVQDYEPPEAQDGVVPRNAYGNVELFKECMLPKGTVHIKLPGLNKVARKLNIDCAPAMTGFDFNGGWSHPVFDGFVVCREFEEIITDAWVKEQEEQERREREKIELRVYGNWKKLIRGLFIRERLKAKYGFEEPTTSQDKKKSKGPRFTAKRNK